MKEIKKPRERERESKRYKMKKDRKSQPELGGAHSEDRRGSVSVADLI